MNKNIYTKSYCFYNRETKDSFCVSISDFQYDVLCSLAECSGLNVDQYVCWALKNNDFKNKSQGIRDVIIAHLIDIILEKKESKMKKFFYRMYLRFKKPEAYGALLECERLQKELQRARRYHYRYAHLQTKLYETRAIFETLRK